MNRSNSLPTVAIVLGLFLFALVPRAFALGNFITVDEAYHWIERVEHFLRFVRQGEYARTNIIGHPGVTTMWLGSIGRLAHEQAVSLGWLAPAGDESALYRAFLRFPLACVSSLSVAAAYPMLRRLAGGRIALLAALLWATDPFLVAHGQLLHLDALLTAFVTLAILAALIAFRFDSAQLSSPPRWGWLLASATLGALAFLTKSPAIILVPVVVLIAGIAFVLDGFPSRFPRLRRLLTLRVVLPLVVWGGVAALVWVALWPAAWGDLPRAIERVVMQVQHDGGDPHGWGNFFLGRAVEAPGPLFYPVVLALRMTPWTMMGLFAAALVALRSLIPASEKLLQGGRGMPWLGMLVCFALLFLVMMSIPPKTFDRYILPIFPTLNIVAAFGFARLLSSLKEIFCRNNLENTKRGGRHVSLMKALRTIATIATIGLLAGNLAWYHPYELAYYNPLVGGGAMAVQAIPVGWGEGYEQAGAFISAQYNGCQRATATWFAPVLYRFLCNRWVVSLDQVFEPGAAAYAVLYIDQMQRGNKPDATAWLRRHLAPLHTVRIHGIDYASIYQLPLPMEHSLSADFGPSIRLTGYETVRAGDTLTLTLQWEPRERMHRDYMLFVHVLNSAGERVAQIDVPPGGPRAPTRSWLLNSSITWSHPLPLPPDLPAGTYWIGIGIYDPDSFARLPVRGPPQPDAPDDGPDVLMLSPLPLER
jgi:4-amino-4-deoxy-L-arabinose transferase-like glycosyltransferase